MRSFQYSVSLRSNLEKILCFMVQFPVALSGLALFLRMDLENRQIEI